VANFCTVPACNKRTLHFKTLQVSSHRSQWPRGLRHGFATVRLLGFSGLNPAGCVNFSLMFVVGCQVEDSTRGRSLVHWNPAVCVCVCVCVSLNVIRRNSNLLPLQWEAERGQHKKGRKKEWKNVGSRSCNKPAAPAQSEKYRVEMHDVSREVGLIISVEWKQSEEK